MVVFWLILIIHINAFSIEKLEVESDVFENRHTVKKSEGQQRQKRNCKIYPFDVICHGRCPRYDGEWESLRTKWNCSSRRKGATYHCTEDIHGNITQACGIPKPCDKGKGVIIKFPQGHEHTADIECEWCPEGWFNPEESKMSDTFYICPRMKETCKGYGMEKCDEPTGVERHWTDSKCHCDISSNFFPSSNEINNCTYESSLMCTKKTPCLKSADGFDQIYTLTSNGYECKKGCKDGFEFKTPQSKICEAIGVDENSNGTVTKNVTVSITNSSSPAKTKSEDAATITPQFTATKNESKPKAAMDDINSREIVGWAVGIGIGLGGTIIYIIIGVYKYKNNGSHGRRSLEGTQYASVQNEEGTHCSRDNEGGQNESQDNGSGVSGLYIVFCWPCYTCIESSKGESASGTGREAGENSGIGMHLQGEQRWVDDLPEELKRKNLRDIPNIPTYIGDGWEEIAKRVGLLETQIDHIKDENNSMHMKISRVINKYIQSNAEPTVLNFLKLLRECPAYTNIQWKELEKHIKEYK